MNDLHENAVSNAAQNDVRNRLVPPGSKATLQFNKFIGFLARHGVSLMGSRELSVRGRKSGEWRSNPVNLLIVDGQRYLISPRGRTHWVRNIRVAGGGKLRLGRKVEEFTATELDDAVKLPIIRAYMKKWAWEVSALMDGLTKNATDEQINAIAPGVPVFRIN
ncbi:nitroreductase/quinone reductase family protein [Actinomadura rupiterrae]|uniref:nitroreductase/quinone reductase family protein n=1 Tax=Actinomadura rupiterrae TaxID=559627 RepID=UPI0020A3BD31|nr:nitroreductase/quinone reductase family protein [Actinomadura rupiterrae]MCP2335843.1 deazaflavin-dependent oxidoreductase (nitroreductase family) [Actinomadura rupiterrae]